MNTHLDLENDKSARRPTRWVKRPNSNPVSDATLARVAADKIKCLTTVSLESIRVTACNGWLQLEGAVAWEHQRTTLEELTRGLPGVRGVINSISIEPIPTWAKGGAP